MFSDYIHKLEYYKQRAIDLLVKQGIPLNTGNIEKELMGIDLSIATFNQQSFKNDSVVDVQLLNKMLLEIMKDLEILYEVVYKEVAQELNKSKRQGLVALNNLLKETTSTMSRIKANTSSSVNGKNLASAVGKYDAYQTNEYLNINIGSFTVPSGTKIAFLADTDIPNEDMQAIIKTPSTEVSLLPHTESRQHVVMIGNKQTAVYEISLDEDVMLDDNISIRIPSVSPNENNDYTILSQKGKYRMDLFDGSTVFTPIDTTSEYIYGETASFYVYDATYIDISFATEPDAKSFNSNNISAPKKVEYLQFFYEEDTINKDLSFVIKTDGTIYGQGETSIIDGDKLYIGEPFEAVEYFVVAEEFGEPISCSATAKIKNGNTKDIRGLYIKEVGEHK